VTSSHGHRAERAGTESLRRRVTSSAAVGVVAGLVTALVAPWQLAVLVGWDVVAALLVGRVWTRLRHFSPEQTQALATREDDSRTSSELLVLAAAVASLGGAAAALLKAHQSDAPWEAILTGATVLTVALSWALVHTVFALRYAHLYYAPNPEGHIDFKSGPDYQPDYGDFAYVAFTIGMTFQVSDTDVGSRLTRRTVLQHALLAYLFGAVIVALMVNVIAALLNR
jgi:uncharacterized membrane protein